MSAYPCGGCEGQGAHRRWCAASVGDTAAHWGRHAEAAENMGDQIGPTPPGAANALYRASGILRAAAEAARDEWRTQ